MFYPLSIISLLIQVALIVHVIRSGRNGLWIMAIALLPFVGSLAYVVVELLPSMFGGRTARRARAGMQRMIDPDRDLRQASAEVQISGNVDARRRLAEELFERKQYAHCIETYEGGLKGVFEHDPTLLQGLARAYFEKGDFAAARATLERLELHNPDFKNADEQLLHARSLEASGALEEAEQLYAVIAPGYPGAEARFRYGALLKKRGKSAEARQVLKELLEGAQLSPAHYRRAQAPWLDRARRELS